VTALVPPERLAALRKDCDHIAQLAASARGPVVTLTRARVIAVSALTHGLLDAYEALQRENAELKARREHGWAASED